MTPIDIFTEWFDTQNKTVTETIAALILYYAPDFDIVKDADIDNMGNSLKQYLNTDGNFQKIIGKILYVQNAIRFIIKDYDDVDSLIDNQNILLGAIKSGEEKGHEMNGLKSAYDNGYKWFTEKQIFKENWIKFEEKSFNDDLFDTYIKDNLLRR